MDFWLGAHHPDWLARVDFPLFVSHRALARYKRLPRAAVPWALDSGAFTELQTHGKWTLSAAGYVEVVERYAAEVGRLVWCAPQDWMCEPFMLERTGLPLREHQERTVANYLELADTGIPVIPVLQGWRIADYIACLGLYAEAGVNLAAAPLVGVGSVCRRQNTDEAGAIFATLARLGLALHGFGVKVTGLARYGDHLESADSMAWSYDGRRSIPLPGHTHVHCGNCLEYASRWRRALLAGEAIPYRKRPRPVKHP